MKLFWLCDKEKGQTFVVWPDLVEASYLTYCFGAANTIFTVPLNWGGGFYVPGSSLMLDKSIA